MPEMQRFGPSGPCVMVTERDAAWPLVRRVREMCHDRGYQGQFAMWRVGDTYVAGMWDDPRDMVRATQDTQLYQVMPLESWKVTEQPPHPHYLASRMKPAWEAAQEALRAINDAEYAKKAQQYRDGVEKDEMVRHWKRRGEHDAAMSVAMSPWDTSGEMDL